MTEVFGTSNKDKPGNKRIKLDYTADYKKLISLLLGSLYVSFKSQTFSNSDHVKKRLVGEASQATAALPDQPVQFAELKSKPLGDIKRKKSLQLLKFFTFKLNNNLFYIFTDMICLYFVTSY